MRNSCNRKIENRLDIGVVGVENGYIKLLSNRAREPVRIFYWETKHMTVKKKQKNLSFEGEC